MFHQEFRKLSSTLRDEAYRSRASKENRKERKKKSRRSRQSSSSSSSSRPSSSTIRRHLHQRLAFNAVYKLPLQSWRDRVHAATAGGY